MEFVNKPITEKEMNYFSLCDGHPCADHDKNCNGCKPHNLSSCQPNSVCSCDWPWHCAQVSDNR